ncbi:uncharacterized protein Dyak_GE27952 [Drosophila yakuba]|uniref:Uncharacterized protein n=1 Tax=Drosophila yakuba TaxID=7245 RepID=A0A0R1DUG0_DROYA|nr:uncharacterized protein Dyak_GE27952 [Drosophila yakuba]
MGSCLLINGVVLHGAGKGFPVTKLSYQSYVCACFAPKFWVFSLTQTSTEAGLVNN